MSKFESLKNYCFAKILALCSVCIDRNPLQQPKSE